MSILKLTLRGPVSRALLSRDARVPFQVTEEALRRFFDDGLIKLRRGLTTIDEVLRVTVES